MAKMVSGIYSSRVHRRELYTPGTPKGPKRPILDWTGVRFDCYDAYSERHKLKKAGFEWSPGAQCWWTKDYKKAMKFARYATADAKKAIKEAKKNERLDRLRVPGEGI